MVSYKGDLYKLLLVHVMAAPTILVPAEENLGDPIEIRVDIERLLEMPTQRWEEIEEELMTLRERANRAETEGVTLHARVRSLEVVETWLHGIVKDEREARERIERQLGLVQEELESLRRSRLS
ncbi:hypothetical protein Tco_0116935 [Tanacetum coccineum]